MTGSQEPRIRIEPEGIVETEGTDAALLMSAYAYELDPWQVNTISCWLGKGEDGSYVTTSAGLAVPRQNGKNVCIEAREFYGMLIHGEKILHTAHQVKTSKRSFRRLERLFTDKRHPEIMDQVKQIRYTNGEERIELINGGVIEYSARSRQSARGFDGISLVIFDEAQELTDDQIEALLPTLSASATGTRQIIYTGTPPYPGCPGDIFRRRRRACISDNAKHNAWHEWSVEAGNVDEIAIDDRSLWYMANPALGRHQSEDFMEEELKTMSPDGFARECLGWWAPELEHNIEMAINAEAWKECMSSEAKPQGKTAFGVKFSADGSEVCLCGSVIPAEGKPRISIIERQPTVLGIQWLADWLNERYGDAACVVIDGRNGVDVLIDKISGTWKAKNSIVKARTSDVIASVGMLVDAVNERGITWYAKHTQLNDSAMSATKRKIGSGWGFGGENSVPIEAAALAYWGARTSRRDPNRKMRIG